MKKKLIMLVLSVCTLFNGNTGYAKDYPQKFWDVPKDHWAFEYIADLADRGVINGYEDGSFMPSQTVTRAEWAKIMVDAAGLLTNDNSVSFNDMNGHWANKYVNAAKNYLTGYKDGSYRPNQAAVREDVTVAMIALKGYNLNSVDYSVLSKFTDNDSISNYAKQYVAVAIQKDLISGFEDNTFRGQATLTRAEAATLLYKAFQKGSDDKVTDIPTLPETTEPSGTTVIEPTPAPTATPEPIPEPIEPEMEEIIEDEESTIATVDTLVRATNIYSVYDYTFDNDGNIYYNDGARINKYNIKANEVEEFQLIADLDLDDTDISFSDFQISNICYDNTDDTLIIQGSYHNVNYVNPDEIANSFIIKSPGPDPDDYLELVNGAFGAENNITWEDDGISKIIATTKSGNLITNYQILDSNGKEHIADITPPEAHWVLRDTYTKVAYETDDGIAYVTADDSKQDGHSLNMYDYSSSKCLYTFDATAYALTNNSLYTLGYNEYKQIGFNGKITQKIAVENIKVLDARPIDCSNILEKMYADENGQFVIYYDMGAKAFRILKIND